RRRQGIGPDQGRGRDRRTRSVGRDQASQRHHAQHGGRPRRVRVPRVRRRRRPDGRRDGAGLVRSEEHTSELQSLRHLVCRLLLRLHTTSTLFPYTTLFRSYVVVKGSARIKVEDEIVELGQWDAIRLPKDTMRNMEAGPEGCEYLAFGAGDDPMDAEMAPGW